MEAPLVVGLLAAGAWALYTLLVQIYRRNDDVSWWLIGQGILIVLVGAPSFFLLAYTTWPRWGVLISEALMMIVLWVILTQNGDDP